jgi:hypothetical protein
MASICRCFGPALWSTLADPQEVGRLRREITIAMDEHAVVNAKRERVKKRPKTEMQDQPDPARIEERLLGLRDRLDGVGLRSIAPYELQEMFNEALDKTQRRLLITSTTVDAWTADAGIIRRITDRLAEGVDIRIETSNELDVNPRGKVGAFEPAVQLWLESKQRVGLTLARRPEESEELFFLVKDDDLAIISDRPFLSGAGQKKCFTPCAAVVTRRPQQVREIASLAGLKDIAPPTPRKKKSRA